MSAYNTVNPYGCWGASATNAVTGSLGQWSTVEPWQLQNQLESLASLGQSPSQRRQQRIDSACRWFATKWRTRAAEIGVQAAARLMRKQGVPCEIAVSILATRQQCAKTTATACIPAPGLDWPHAQPANGGATIRFGLKMAGFAGC